MKTEFEADKFRQNIAIIAKHMIFHKSGAKIYQIERKMTLTNLTYEKVKDEIMGSDFAKKLKQDIYKQAVKGVALLKGAIGLAATISTGIVVGAAICAAIAIFDYYNTKQVLSPETQLKNVIDKARFEDIKAFFNTYLYIFQSSNKFSQYFADMMIKPSNTTGKVKDTVEIEKIDKVQKIQQLMGNKNLLYVKIESPDFEGYDVTVQLDFVELYYRLTKALLQIIAIGWNSEIKQHLNKLFEQHKKVKSVMVNIIAKKIRITGGEIRITGQQKHWLEDPQNHCQLRPLANEIFNETFKCPLTGVLIDDMYQLDVWAPSEKTNKKQKASQVQTYPKYRYLGVPQTKYNSIRSQSQHRVRKMAISGDSWACYYENLDNMSGNHDKDYNDPSIFFDFDRYILLYANGTELTMMNDKYQTKVLAKIPLLKGLDTNHCIELSKNESVMEVRSSGVTNICLVVVPSKKVLVNKNHNKLYFDGSISYKLWDYKLAYGRKGFMSSYGYNFQKSDSQQFSQKLIYEAVTPLEYFKKQEQKRDQIQMFKCRITNQYDSSLYMARDSRQSQSGNFGYNKSGGELITVRLDQKTSKQNEYTGSLEVAGCKVYISSSGNLEWTKGQIPAGASEKLNIQFEQL